MENTSELRRAVSSEKGKALRNSGSRLEFRNSGFKRMVESAGFWLPGLFLGYSLFHNGINAFKSADGFVLGLSSLVGVLSCEGLFLYAYHKWREEQYKTTAQGSAFLKAAVIAAVFITTGLLAESGGIGSDFYYTWVMPISPAVMTFLGGYCYATDPTRTMRLKLAESRFLLSTGRLQRAVDKGLESLRLQKATDAARGAEMRLAIRATTRYLLRSPRSWWQRRRDARVISERLIQERRGRIELWGLTRDESAAQIDVGGDGVMVTPPKKR